MPTKKKTAKEPRTFREAVFKSGHHPRILDREQTEENAAQKLLNAVVVGFTEKLKKRSPA